MTSPTRRTRCSNGSRSRPRPPPPNLPLPAKIVTRVLEPIDVVAEFGEDPDVEQVDLHVRAVMQAALDDLARNRRFPILG